MEEYQVIWAFILLIGFLVLIVLLTWEVSDMQCAKAIRKMRKQDERKATEEAQLKEKIRSIAKAVCVEDSMAVQGMKGNVYTSEDGKSAISVFASTMKGHE